MSESIPSSTNLTESRTPAVNILCMKWGTVYGPEYVNRLYAGVQRHLQRSFRFVCLTDDDNGLDDAVECYPIPAVQSVQTGDSRWKKLGMLAAEVADLSGTVLFLDLDVVIVGSLDAYFETEGDVVLVRDADLFPARLRRRLNPERLRFYQTVGNTSVMRFEAGKHEHHLQAFEAQAETIAEAFKNEQEYLSAKLIETGQLAYWPDGWNASFKHDCVPKGLASYQNDPQCPANARIILFAGRLKMTDVLAGQGSRWYRRVGPVPWLEQAWLGESQ